MPCIGDLQFQSELSTVCNDLIFVRRYWPVTHIFVIAAQTENYIQIWLQLHTAGNMTSHKHTQSHTHRQLVTQKNGRYDENLEWQIWYSLIFLLHNDKSQHISDRLQLMLLFLLLPVKVYSGTMHSIHSCVFQVCFIFFNGKQDTSNFVFPKVEIWVFYTRNVTL